MTAEEELIPFRCPCCGKLGGRASRGATVEVKCSRCGAVYRGRVREFGCGAQAYRDVPVDRSESISAMDTTRRMTSQDEFIPQMLIDYKINNDPYRLHYKCHYHPIATTD